MRLLLLAIVLAGCGVKGTDYVRDMDDLRDQASREAQANLPPEHRDQDERGD